MKTLHIALWALLGASVIGCDDTAKAVRDEAREETRDADEVLDRTGKQLEKDTAEARKDLKEAASDARRELEVAAEKTERALDEADDKIAREIAEDD